MPRLLLTTLVLFAVLAPAASADAPRWLGSGVMNIAHQGGEAELPSNTMYAFTRSLRGGADMLELDVSRTADDRLVVMHDATVDRTTDGTGYLTDLTLAQVRRLDAAHNFVPGRNAVAGLPARRYPLRGVRTGERRPPRGFDRADFRVPTLAEVIKAFPHTPINIEIKGRDDDAAQFLRNAELLAAELHGTRRRDLIVVSFNQPAVDRFHELVPRIPVAPGVDGISRFLLGGASPGEGVVALQVPITYELGGQRVEVTTPESVLATHRAGYAVQVWLSGGEESRRVYGRLLDMCVDGIMAATPGALERLLRARDVVRPGGRGTDPCAVEAARAERSGRSVELRLKRRGLGPQTYRGTVTLRTRGRRLARAPFTLSEGRDAASVTMRIHGGARRVVAEVRTRGARGEPVRTALRLR